MNNLDPIDLVVKLPEDLAVALEADPFFCDIPVVVADDGNVQQTIEQLQSVIGGKNLKRGIAVIVLPLIADDETPEVEFGPLTLYPAFEVIEQRALNRDVANGGTGKRAIKVARQIIKVLKPLMAEGLYTSLVCDKPAIVPVPTDKDHPNVLRKHVNFKAYEADDDKAYQLLTEPDYAQNVAGTFTLNGPANALIYYTLDDSFPSPNNVDAVYAPDAPTVPTWPKGQSFLLAPGENIPVPAQGFFVRARSYPPKGAPPSFTADDPPKLIVQVPSMVTRAFLEPN